MTDDATHPPLCHVALVLLYADYLGIGTLQVSVTHLTVIINYTFPGRTIQHVIEKPCISGAHSVCLWTLHAIWHFSSSRQILD